MNYISETDKAWLAGFIDGEGYIGIVRQRKLITKHRSDSWLYHPWVILTNTDPNIIPNVIRSVSIGKQALQRRTELRYKDSYQWKITNHDDVVEFLTCIRPFLKIKGDQAGLLIKYCLERKNKKIITGRGSRGKSSFDSHDEEIYLELKRLNKKGVSL